MLLDREHSTLILVDVQEKLLPCIENAKDMQQRCAWLLTLAKEMDVPVLISEQYPKGLGATVQELQDIDASLKPLAKVAFSCARDNAFSDALAVKERRQVIVMGIEAHVCVLQSALDLLSMDYQVFIVVDAVGSRAPLDKKYALKRMQQAGAQLITSEMVFFEWLGKAGTDEFKQLSKKYLQSSNWRSQ